MNLYTSTQQIVLVAFLLDVEFKCGNVLITQVAPKDLPLVQTMGCGACANEHAFKAAFMGFRVRLDKIHLPFNPVIFFELKKNLCGFTVQRPFGFACGMQCVYV